MVHVLFYYSSNGTAEHNFTCMSISDLMAFPSAHFNFSLAFPKIKKEDRDLICNFFNDYLVSMYFLLFSKQKKMRFKPKMYDKIEWLVTYGLPIKFSSHLVTNKK